MSAKVRPEALRHLYAQMEAAGCKVERRKHRMVIITPSEAVVFGPIACKDYRGVKNLRALLRRNEVPLE